VACATGAEPFSIAAAALAAGIPAAHVRVAAVDPNPEALARASSGTLGHMAVRGGIPEWARGMFRADEDGVTVDAEVRRCVHLHRGSAPGATASFPNGSCNAVFCRNLAIYLSTDARAAIGRELDRVLAPDGERDSFTVSIGGPDGRPLRDGAWHVPRSSGWRWSPIVLDPSRDADGP
jgi:chemotaxis protein methyltransferase WspC